MQENHLEVKDMSLEKDLAALISTDQETPIDVAMKLLDPTDAIMHTEIRDPKTMNQLAVMIEYCNQTNDKEEAAIWKAAYDARVLHMVSFNRKRAVEIKDMFASLQALYSNQIVMENGKKGLFGKK